MTKKKRHCNRSASSDLETVIHEIQNSDDQNDPEPLIVDGQGIGVVVIAAAHNTPPFEKDFVLSYAGKVAAATDER